MSGAPIVVLCYRNGVSSYGTWLTDPTMLDRIRTLAHEGGKSLVADVIWYNREPWTKAITDAWAAVDTFDVSLALDRDRPEPVAPAKALRKKRPKR
ncbi:MAG: hypothetical protein EPO40_38080 [Myxococcaceae bacterium]|nr:MAG: hypothetical protein EPO40_38080 [Myxococcaceae bacterium]